MTVKITGKPPIHLRDRVFCPECQTDLTGALLPGYGLAFGGGLGTYWYCSSDTCDWFYKVYDEDSEVTG